LPPWPAIIEKPIRRVITGKARVVTATPELSGSACPKKRLFGGFCGRDSGIGPAQRAKTTIWN